MKNPRFSICIPTIGRFDLIKTALASLRAQTFQDFEVIIGDSHRNKDIVRLVSESNDPRIKIVHPPPEAGAFSPWDYPPRFAKGEYVMWLDDDNCLLPFTLNLFAAAIDRTHADIITGNHVYYYDEKHPKPHMRRCLGIVPFTEKEYTVDLETVNRRLLSFSLVAPGTGHPRFHFSATVVARSVIEKIYARLGHVLFPDLPHMYSLYPILFVFAKSCHFIDLPVAVVGRLGVSMGQTWSTSARTRFEKDPHRMRGLSPLTAYTKVNSVYENYLRTRKELPEYFENIQIDENRFAEVHLSELFLLDTPARAMVRNWLEFFRFLTERVSEPDCTRLRKKARVLVMLSPIVFISRRLRLHYLRRFFAGKRAARRERERPSVALWDREFSVPLPRDTSYDSITGVAKHVPELILSITGRDIT